MRLATHMTRICFLMLIVLSGCATNPSTDDTTGQLGATQKDSPANLYMQLAIAYMRDGQNDIALRKLKKAIELDPRHGQSHNVLGILYERLDASAQAEEHYLNAIKYASKDPYIRNAWGSFLCKNNRLKEADKQYNLALQNPLYTTPWVALSNAGTCARKIPDLTKAESYFRKALTLKNNYPIALSKMVHISFEHGNYLSARAYLQRYLQGSKHTADTLWLGIQVENALGNKNTAASYEQLLRQEFPDSQEVQQIDESKRS